MAKNMYSNPHQLALGLLLGLSCQAGWAQSPAGKALLEQGIYWQAQGNNDRAAEAWKKLLRLQPDEPRALYGLGQVELSLKRGAGATEMLNRLRALDPNGAYAALLAQDIGLKTGDGPKMLDKARLLFESREYDKALEQYQLVLGARDPVGDIGLEYYRVVAELPSGWKQARSGLERLARQAPNDAQIEMNLAFLLARGEEPRQETRVEGIERLARVALVPSVSGYATESWKMALTWLGVTKPDHLALFDTYLKLHPDDAEVRDLRAIAVKKLQAIAKSLEPGQLNPLIAGGLKALSLGELLQAESQFQSRLKTHAKDPDALGGLGLVRMQQNRWDESLALLTQAAQQKNGSNWSKSLLTARYQVLIEQGTTAQREGDNLQARSLLQQAIRLDPKQNGAVLALAALQFEAGEIDTAEKTYRQVLAKNNAEVDALRGLANLLAAGDKIDEARKLIDRLTPEQVGGPAEMSRLRATVASGVAKAALRRGDVVLAQATLEKALAQDRDNPWIRWELAQLYTQQGRNSEARGLIDGLLASQPNNPVALFASASFAANRGQWRTALARLDQITPADRTADMATLQKRSWLQHQAALAVSLARQGRKAEAQALLEQAEPLTGGNRDLLGVLAEAYVDAGAPNRGLSLLRQVMARSSQPAAADSLLYASLLLKTQQDVECRGVLQELANKTLTASERKRLEDLTFFHTLRQVDLLRERGELAEGRTLLAPMLAQRPEDPLVNAVLVRMTAAAGDKRRALELARQLVTKHPENLEIQLSSAQLATQFKDVELANSALNTALALAPDDAEVLAAAARLYRAQGKSAQAATLFERAIALQNAPAPGHDAILAAANSVEANPADLLNDSQATLSLRAASLQSTPTRPLEYWRQELAQGKSGLVQVANTAPTSSTASTGSTATTAASKREVESGAVTAATAANLAAAKRADDLLAAAPPPGPNMYKELDEIRQARSPELQAAAYSRQRNGAAGSSQLQQTTVPVELRFPVGEGKVGLQLTAVTLNAGTASAAAVGSATADMPATQTAKGVGAAVSYSREGLTVDAGMTPAGFIFKDVTAGIKVNGALKDDGSLAYRVNLSRRPVTDSLLSFAGARDAASGKTWGGVMASGARLDLTQALNGYGVTGTAAWHNLSGHDVASNGRSELGLGTYFNLLSKADKQISTGLNFSSLAYQKNLGDFGYGQGGYFSPQRYHSLTVPLNWSQRSGAVNFLLQGSLGYQQFSQDIAGTALTGASSQSSSGLAYRVATSAQFQLAPQWLLDANLESDNSASGSFRQWGAGLNLRYSFHPSSQAQPLLFNPSVAPYGQ